MNHPNPVPFPLERARPDFYREIGVRSFYEDKSTKTKTPCCVHDVFVNYVETGLLDFWYHTPDAHINNCIAVVRVISSVVVNINPLKTFIGR